jgi:WD40 repeat protein
MSLHFGLPVKVFNEQDFGPSNVTFSPTGHLFVYLTAASATGVIKIFDVNNWNLIKQLPNEDKSGAPWFTALAFSPDGRWLAAGTVNNGITLYDTRDWSVRSHFVNHIQGRHMQIDSIAFSPDGRILAFAGGIFDSAQNTLAETIKLSDLDGTLIRTVADLPGAVGPVTFSHDGKRIAFHAYDSKLWICDASGHSPPLTFAAPTGRTGGTNVIFNHDDTWLASGSIDGTVTLWNTGNGELLQTLTWHSTPTQDGGMKKVLVKALALSPDGRLLASNENETIALWDALTGSFLKNYLYHTNQAYSELVDDLAFSSDGRFLAESNGHTKLAIVWQVNK